MSSVPHKIDPAGAADGVRRRAARPPGAKAQAARSPGTNAKGDQPRAQLSPRAVDFPPDEHPRASRTFPAAAAWIAAFAAAEYLFWMPELGAFVPGTVLRLISLPLALLALALMLRPPREWVAYALIYVGLGVLSESAALDPEFTTIRLSIAALEMIFLVAMLYRYFFHRFVDPLAVGAWAIFLVAICAVGAFLMVAAASILQTGSDEALRALGGSLGVAWRNWWLGTACSFLALAGPVATLVNLRHRLKHLFASAARTRFIGLTIALAATSLFAFSLADMPWLGLPPDVILAVRLLPLPFAMAMAAGFRANGAAVAILIFSLIGAYSATLGGVERSLQGTPMPGTPRQTLILITTITCMVLAGISRQLRVAVRDAEEASQAKSRFVAMLNHELRTPLNAILGFSELMRIKNLRDMDEAIGPIENIHASGQRLLAMIEGLLNQADHGAGMFEIHRRQLDLVQAIEQAVAEVGPQFEAAGARLECTTEAGLQVDADANGLQQMLTVILSRAARNSRRGTRFTVVAKRSGTNTVVEFEGTGMRPMAHDPQDRVERQLVTALALAHGARLKLKETSESNRITRLTFFATHAAG